MGNFQHSRASVVSYIRIHRDENLSSEAITVIRLLHLFLNAVAVFIPSLDTRFLRRDKMKVPVRGMERGRDNRTKIKSGKEY